jgi:hypothetical protein
VQDWNVESQEDEAAADEEQLIRVQQEIERLRQEQESIMRRQAIAQCAEAHRQHINRERTGLTELQYTVNILHQQKQRQEPSLVQRQHQDNINPLPPRTHNPPPAPQFSNIRHYQPPSPTHNQFLQPPPPPLPQLGNTDPKSPLANHLQLAPWPSHYRATLLPKYHGNTDPHKFLMCYEAAIASPTGDETTLAKSLIISLKDAAAN